MSTVLIGEILAVLLFVVGTFGVLLGFPIAFTLAGFSLMFAAVGWSLGAFDPIILTSLPSRYFGLMTNEVLVAVPLFIFMGAILERSKIAEALLETMGQLFGTMRGGLAISVVIVGALLAASTGVVGATVVTMGLLSLPAMMRAGYDPRLATGVICASGTLGQIIPPSVILIFVGDLLMGANQLAAQRTGRPLDPVSVGDLFIGAFIPGIALVGLYILYVLAMAVLRPASCPPLEMDAAERASLPARFVRALIPPLVLIVAVLGSILSGIATPTEAASIGALGAMVLAALNRAFSFGMLLGAMRNTAVISALVFGIVLGVSVFSLVFRGLGGEHLVEQLLADVPGGAFGAVMAVMMVMFVLGFFMDTVEIVLIVVPITAPVIIAMGVDPLWLGVMIGVNLQTASSPRRWASRCSTCAPSHRPRSPRATSTAAPFPSSACRSRPSRCSGSSPSSPPGCRAWSIPPRCRPSRRLAARAAARCWMTSWAARWARPRPAHHPRARRSTTSSGRVRAAAAPVRPRRRSRATRSSTSCCGGTDARLALTRSVPRRRRRSPGHAPGGAPPRIAAGRGRLHRAAHDPRRA